MANEYKILGQSNPAATTLTDVLTVSGGSQVIVSTITVANLEGSANTYRIAVRDGGASIDNAHYVAYDTTIPANDTVALTLGITLGETDVISVYASDTNLAFNVYGVEIT